MDDYSRCCAYIDIDAFIDNINEIKRVIRPRTKVVAVIKTDGYGHGATALSKELEKLDLIWGYAVATVSEADILRESGAKKPILILGATFPSDYEDIIKRDIRPAVFSFDTAKALSDTALRLNRTVNIHIKIDSGMSRIGFDISEESVNEILKISDLPGIIIEGIFTHFSKADETDLTYAKKQLDSFKKMISMTKERGLNIPLKHCSNSAGIISLPEANMDMVRAGIIIYGLWPSDEVARDVIDLKPVMTLKSRIVHVKSMPAGIPVSYGGTYVTKAGDVIATVSFGYGDGYPRGLSNKGYVLVRGRKAPIVGRVCMDQFMINVRDIPGVSVNDPVTLVGKDGDHSITVEELGDISGRFNYEFTCDITARVPRVYVRSR